MKNTLVVGLGGAGTSLAKYVESLLDCDSLAVSSNASELNKSGFESKLLIGSNVCKGNSAVVPHRGKLAAEESIDELEKALASHETIVLLAGLGGGTGTGALQVAMKLPSLKKKNLVIAVTLPYGFEETRRNAALEALVDLQSQHPEILVYDNELLLQDTTNNRATLVDVFDHLAQKVAEDIRVRLDSAA
jgi:cell division protein FtsZ